MPSRSKTPVLISLILILIIVIVLLAVFYPSILQLNIPPPKNAPETNPHPANASPASTSGPLNHSASEIPSSCGLLRVYVINVSQADAILIITPSNRTIMIDSGSGMKKNSSTNALAFLKKMGVARIDYLIATHYHEDHIGGMNSMFKDFDIGTVYDNGNCGNYSSVTEVSFQGYALSHDFIHVKTDMDMPAESCLARAQLIVAYDRPEGCWNSNKDTSNENDNSILLRLAYGNTSFLFTGDCEADCEAELLKQGTYLRSDFLKVGHHGSATSSTQPFLDAVGAEYFAISTDKARSVTDGYYHPRQASLSNIFSHDAFAQGASHTFRTDLEGDIAAVSDGSAITITAAANAAACQIFSGYSSSSVSSYGPIPPIAGSCG